MARSEGWSALFSTAFRQSRNAMVLPDDRRRHVDANGAYLKLLGHTRAEVLCEPVFRFVAGGPLLSPDEWEEALAAGNFTGRADMLRADGGLVAVQFGGHVEVVTGRRLVLFVALSTSRWGGRFRRTPSSEPPRGTLSERERQVVQLVADGHSGPEIAEELHISHDTVRTHVRNAMTKLGARSRAHLVAKAIAEGHVLQAT
jgi:DNA-binding CsgD family transcriptional regulator